VQRPIYQQFLDAFTKVAEGWTAGDPFDRTTRLGPLVHKRQYDRVMSYLDVAKKEGRILFGGGRPPGIDKGYYVAPTAIVDVENSARVCQEEIFGPVAVIMPFDDADDALRIANDSSYGLAGYIWSESQTTAHYVSHRLQTAMIWINAGFERDLRQPFGQVSGVGPKAARSREFYTRRLCASLDTAWRRE
jgi:acyl-CoA reductase-like NAD-dependent aldehyde dehydrogenase